MSSKSTVEAELDKAKQIQKKQLVFFLVVLVFITAFFYWFTPSCKSCEKKLNNEFRKYSFLDPARNMIEQKDAITNIDPLRKSLKDLAFKESANSKISLYFEVLNTGANIAINPDEKIFPASLAKVPMAMLVMKNIEKGKLGLNDQFDITDENLNSSSGELFREAKIGSKLEISRILREMLVYSDNTAYRILKRNTSPEERKILAEEIGLGDLFEEQGKISAKEYSRLLRTLYNASYLNQDNSQMVLKMLSENKFNDYLMAALPGEILFSHKHGQNLTLNIFSDSGIVYLNQRPYILSVMIEPLNLKGYEGEEYAKILFRQISEQTYQYMKNK